jgi:hypothetical protein
VANKTREFYLTEDLHLAAYLIASGKADLREIVGNSYWKKSFKLFPSPSEKELSEFYTGLAKVSAIRLCETLRSLKAALRNREAFSDGRP